MTLSKLEVSNAERRVQEVPFTDVATLVCNPVEFETATNNPVSELQHTDVHNLTAGEVRSVHVMPSGEVINILLPAITNSRNSGLQQTALISVDVPRLRKVHVIPSGDDIIEVVLDPVDAVATNRLNSGLQHTEFHS